MYQLQINKFIVFVHLYYTMTRQPQNGKMPEPNTPIIKSEFLSLCILYVTITI